MISSALSSAVSHARRRASRSALVTLALLLVFASSALATTLHHDVQAAANHSARRGPGRPVRLTAVHQRRGWAYGDAVLLGTSRKQEGPQTFAAFLAHRHGSGWRVAIQGSGKFLAFLRASPRGLVPARLRKLYLAGDLSTPNFGGSGPAGPPDFSLPWATGTTWKMWQGPHNTNGASFGHPFTSLDLSQGDGVVRAAADGVAYTPCANLVVLDHGSGWETGYYHLSTIAVRQGQYVQRGAVVGRIGNNYSRFHEPPHGCGGGGSGDHVHFSIYHFATGGVRNVFRVRSADMNGVVIGGWVVHDGGAGGGGYLQRLSDGFVVRPTISGGAGAIYNDGTVGRGGKPEVPPGYITLAAVNVYAGPGIPYRIVGSLATGTPVDIACQTRGTTVHGSSIWDQIGPGQFISDYYVSTPNIGTFSPGIPQCSGSTSGGGGTSGGGTAGLPPLDGGAHDTSFEHEDPWATLNGGTQQNDVCGDGTAHDGQCFLDVSGSAAPGNTFIEDFAHAATPGQCFTLSAWFRSRSAASFSGTLAIWVRNFQSDQAASTAFTVGTGWTHVSVTMRTPTPSGAAWSRLRGQVYLNNAGQLLDWDLTQWFGPYSC